MKSVEIILLGKKYFFKSDHPEKLKKCGEFLNSQLEELNKKFNTVDQNKLFVLYSLILTEKYFSEIDANKKLSQKMNQINSLLNRSLQDNEL